MALLGCLLFVSRFGTLCLERSGALPGLQVLLANKSARGWHLWCGMVWVLVRPILATLPGLLLGRIGAHLIPLVRHAWYIRLP